MKLGGLYNFLSDLITTRLLMGRYFAEFVTLEI
jgi:hypothetical protein